MKKKKKEGWTKKTEEEKNLTLTKQMVQNILKKMLFVDS